MIKSKKIQLYYQNLSNESNESNENKNIISRNPYNRSNKLFTSKVYKFENFPEPRNATEGKCNDLFFDLFLNVINILIFLFK